MLLLILFDFIVDTNMSGRGTILCRTRQVAQRGEPPHATGSPTTIRIYHVFCELVLPKNAG